MTKALLWLVIGLVLCAALYFAGLGLMKLWRSFVREDDLDEAIELKREREALQAENDRADALQRQAQNRTTGQ